MNNRLLNDDDVKAVWNYGVSSPIEHIPLTQLLQAQYQKDCGEWIEWIEENSELIEDGNLAPQVEKFDLLIDSDKWQARRKEVE